MDTVPNADSLSAVSRADRRRTARVDVRINLVGQASSCRVVLVNVSEGGCQLFSSCVLKPGENHTLRFTALPAADEIVLEARVVHVVGVSGHPDIGCLAGMEFTNSGTRHRAAIDRLLAVASRPEDPGQRGE